MTTYSLAAETYATSRWIWDSINWHEAARNFDTGRAHALAAAPAPVLLTDPEDPRIKPGALIEVTHTSAGKVGELVTYRHFIDSEAVGCWSAAYIREHTPIAEYHLIAEAPADPDEPILAALRVNGFVADQLAALRAAGYDVVKQAL